jgi:hypothetical protein
MSEARARVSALYRAELAQEVAAGFPRLKRLPNTQVIRLADYLTALAAPERDALLDAMAHFNAAALVPAQYAAEGAERERHPVFGRFLAATAFRGLAGGYRYTPVKILGGIARDQAIGGLEGWIKHQAVSGLERQPPEGLVPDLGCLTPVKPAKLKKLVEAAFAKVFAPPPVKLASDCWKYVGVIENSQVVVDLFFGPQGRVNPRQLQYTLRAAAGDPNDWRYATYEGLWSLNTVWDYLTEENAERSAALLAELVVYLTGLVARVRGR